ncbi:hypothetical protein COB64_00260 [Candidatus Wolfebacteria bacterium]|nr:MAG: hypothetical protein COB64_00260 [Candidatus Wolfebacteria bacterium]
MKRRILNFFDTCSSVSLIFILIGILGAFMVVIASPSVEYDSANKGIVLLIFYSQVSFIIGCTFRSFFYFVRLGFLHGKPETAYYEKKPTERQASLLWLIFHILMFYFCINEFLPHIRKVMQWNLYEYWEIIISLTSIILISLSFGYVYRCMKLLYIIDSSHRSMRTVLRLSKGIRRYSRRDILVVL